MISSVTPLIYLQLVSHTAIEFGTKKRFLVATLTTVIIIRCASDLDEIDGIILLTGAFMAWLCKMYSDWKICVAINLPERMVPELRTLGFTPPSHGPGHFRARGYISARDRVAPCWRGCSQKCVSPYPHTLINKIPGGIPYDPSSQTQTGPDIGFMNHPRRTGAG